MSDSDIVATRGKNQKKVTVTFKGRLTDEQWEELKAKLRALAKLAGLKFEEGGKSS